MLPSTDWGPCPYLQWRRRGLNGEASGKGVFTLSFGARFDSRDPVDSRNRDRSVSAGRA